MEPDWQADMYPEVFLSERADERVCINISGAHFETFESTLARYPNTLLGSPSRRNKYFDPFRGEYFFDRNRRAFDAILFYYQSNGRISKPDNITEKQFVSELSFFEIGKKEDLLTFPERVDRFILAESHELPKNRLKRIFWQLFSSPDSSIFAKIITIIGIFALALSIVITCAETLPSLMHPKKLWDSIRDKSSEDENGTALKTATNIPAVQNYAQIEKKSPYLERRSPYLEKRSPYLERRSSYLELQY
eukprot:gene16555-7978_t